MGEQNAPQVATDRWRHWWMTALLGMAWTEEMAGTPHPVAPEPPAPPQPVADRELPPEAVMEKAAVATGALDFCAPPVAAPVAPGAVWFLAEAVPILGGPGPDTLQGTAADDVVLGGEGGDVVLAGAGDDHLDGESGDDLIAGEAGADRLLGDSGQDTLRGGDGNDTLVGGADPDTLEGGAGDDLLSGGAGNDLLFGGPGRDTILGGDGWDRMIVGRVSGEAPFIRHPGFVELMAPDGTDVIDAVERIDFLDSSLRFSTADPAAQIYRLYGATLGRAPDPLGLGNWVKAIEAGGLGLATAAQGFVGSAEFQGRYGLPDDGGFVTLLYANVLGRTPDPDGFAAWTGALRGGLDRTAVVLGFAESAENIARASDAVTAGLWVVDPAAVDALRCYVGVLGRVPEAGGLANWTAARNAGLAAADMLAGFVASAEFQGATGRLGTPAYVTYLYGTALGRSPDPGGLAGWSQALDAGLIARFDVALAFANSAECTGRLLGYVDDGILIA